MGIQYKTLKDKDVNFIRSQKLFFVASCSGKEVNISPKGYDSLRFLDEKNVLYLDYPGSGNRTARDIEQNGKITLMFISFDEFPNVLRIFCKGRLIEKNNSEFNELINKFVDIDISLIRRLVLFEIYAVENSCGLSVPYFQFIEKRDGLIQEMVKAKQSNKLENFISKHLIPPDLDNLPE